MAKKDNEVFFNLFNAENGDYFSEDNSSENTSDSEQNFISIAQIDIDDSHKEEVSGQTTMFDNESFSAMFDSKESDSLKEETAPELIVEPVEADKEPESVDALNDDVTETTPVITENEETENLSENENIAVQQFFIEPIDDTETEKSSIEEDKLVSLLETNPLDEEVTEEPIDSDDSIFNNLSTYDEIKKQKSEKFETPYLFKGKTSEHIRYRLYVPSKKKPRENRIKRGVMSWAITIIAAIIIAVLLRSYVFVIATVNGPSMMPTLENNEKLFVTKYTYKFSDMERGDIVICKYGTAAYPDIYVKRIIGLGGEIVSIVDGKVLINNAEISDEYSFEPCVLDMDPVYVPQGYVFVMGDNRNNSADSRKQIIGPLKEELIIGKVQFRITPLNKFGAVEAKQ